jgi:hypothetical protein
MTHRAAAILLSLTFGVLLAPRGAHAQAAPEEPPALTTAENETWYISGAPIAFGGAVYYPSGPVSHFVRSEMVLAGMFERVPIYRRTTQEPGSLVYVPLPGGLVRPYERRRSGELAGTTGSTAPSFPVMLPAEEALVSTSAPPDVPAVPQAVGTSGFMYGALDRARGIQQASAEEPVSALGRAVPEPSGTMGRVAPLAPGTPAGGAGTLRTAQRPVGLNGVFIQFEGARWFAAGPAVEPSPGRFARAGEHRGFPVYRQEGDPDAIYVAHVAGAPGLLVPYRTR